MYTYGKLATDMWHAVPCKRFGYDVGIPSSIHHPSVENDRHSLDLSIATKCPDQARLKEPQALWALSNVMEKERERDFP